MSRIVKTEMKGTGGGRWMRRAEAKSLSKVKRRANDKKAIKEETAESAAKPKERLIEFEVNYTDRVTGGLEAGGIVAPEAEIGPELLAEVRHLLSHADLSKPWSMTKTDGADKKARKRLAAKADLKLDLGSILAQINEMMGLSFSIKERTYEVPWMAGGDSFYINKTGFELRRYFPPQDSGVGIIPWKGNKKFVICVENGEGEIDYISEPIKGRIRTCCHVLAVITEIELMGLPFRKD